VPRQDTRLFRATDHQFGRDFAVVVVAGAAGAGAVGVADFDLAAVVGLADAAVLEG